MGSKSSGTTKTTEHVSSVNENISDVDGSQVFSHVDGGVNILDGDAITNSLSFASDGLSDLLDFGADILEDQSHQLTNTLSSINAANQNEAVLTNKGREQTTRDLGKYLLYAAVIIGAVTLYKKKRG